MIIPKFFDKYTCLQATLKNIFDYYSIEDKFLFINDWTFIYGKKNNNIQFGRRVKVNYNIDILKKFYERGYGFKIEAREGIKDVLGQIEKEIQYGKPVLVKIDSYWCPWNRAYQKFHIDHFFVVIGINESDFICIDSYFSDHIEYLPIKYIKHCQLGFISLESEKKKIDKTNIINLMNKSLESNKELQSIEQLTSFWLDIENGLNFREEISEYNDTRLIPLLINLKHISNSRYNYADFLKYISLQYNIYNLSDLYYKYMAAHQKWEIVRALFFKCMNLNNIECEIKRITNLIKQIIGIERNALLRIIEVVEASR